MRFELDHRTARSRIANCDDFDMPNIIAACRSCNIIKGQMEMKHFLSELRSLGKRGESQIRRVVPEPMRVPSHQEFMRPLLELLKDGAEHKTQTPTRRWPTASRFPKQSGRS